MMLDETRLRQVLFNLVGNAIKFTLNGRIDVHVTKLPNAEDRYEFRVTDTGIGISDDQLERIFDDFFYKWIVLNLYWSDLEHRC